VQIGAEELKLPTGDVGKERGRFVVRSHAPRQPGTD